MLHAGEYRIYDAKLRLRSIEPALKEELGSKQIVRYVRYNYLGLAQTSKCSPFDEANK